MKFPSAILLTGLVAAISTHLPIRIAQAQQAEASVSSPAAITTSPADNAPSAAALLDQAIWWPGDFGQICRAKQEDWYFESPPLPAYGTASRQEYFLSKSRIAELNQQRAAIAAELLKRLKAFDWKHFPPAPEPTSEVKALQQSELSKPPTDGPRPAPWKAENSLALGATMLRIIEATDAVETLPELLRLEEELHVLNEAALEARAKNSGLFVNDSLGPVPDLYIPPIEVAEALGDFVSTVERKTPKDDIFPWKTPDKELGEAWTRWEGRLFGNLVFQREILGVSLGLLERKAYVPLRQSFPGRLTALARRSEGLKLLREAGLRTAADLTEEQRRLGLKVDAHSQLPRFEEFVVLLPCDQACRREVRGLIQTFISGGTVPAPPDGAKLLDEAIAEPGTFDQMCALTPPLASPLPFPAGASLVRRHFNLGGDTISRLQAWRELVIPVLTERLKTVKLETPPGKSDQANADPLRRSGQDSRSFGPLLLQVVENLNAVECLPDLLRLERQLSDLLAKAEADPATPLPELGLDSPSLWDGMDFSDKSPEADRKRERAGALLGCKIYQRELLGLMRTILEREEYAPLKTAAVSRLQLEQGRKALRETAAKVESKETIPWQLTRKIAWDPEKKKAVIAEGDSMPVDIPYTPAIRDEIRSLAETYLKTTPPDKRKAADGMILSWLPPQP